MYFIPIVNALMAALSGFITDILGRKRSAAVLAGTALVGLVSFVLCAGVVSPILVGVSYGLFIGGLWSAADILFIMLPGESTPTNLRVSVVGTMGIMSGVGNVLSIAIMTVGMLFVENIGILCLCVCVPFLLPKLFILRLILAAPVSLHHYYLLFFYQRYAMLFLHPKESVPIHRHLS